MQTEKRFYFIRHGQSEGNKQGFAQTHATPLTGFGKIQAEHLAQRMVREVDHEAPLMLITSTMQRAIETGAIIASSLKRTGVDLATLQQHNILDEIRRPDHIVGRSGEDPEVAEFYKRSAIGLQCGAPAIYDEEVAVDLILRAGLAAKYLLSHAAPQLIVVSHGAFLSVLIDRLMFGEMLTPELFTRTHYHLRNASLTVLDYTKRNTWKSQQTWRWEISVLGDTSHLVEEAVSPSSTEKIERHVDMDEDNRYGTPVRCPNCGEYVSYECSCGWVWRD